MRTTSTRLSSFLREIDALYSLSLEKGKYAVALKALEMKGRLSGFFPNKNTQPKKKLILSELSDEELEEIIADIEKELQFKETQC